MLKRIEDRAGNWGFWSDVFRDRSKVLKGELGCELACLLDKVYPDPSPEGCHRVPGPFGHPLQSGNL